MTKINDPLAALRAKKNAKHLGFIRRKAAARANSAGVFGSASVFQDMAVRPLPSAPDSNMPRPRQAQARSDAFEAIHSAAAGLFSVGAIDKQTMREFDAECLVQPDLKAADVKRIRSSLHVSQAVFARYMNTNKSTVQKWESAENPINPIAQRLLSVIDKHGLDILS
ncbi:MAG: DNA-binding transcriptional regulator [Pseudomonadota bacterium]